MLERLDDIFVRDNLETLNFNSEDLRDEEVNSILFLDQ